jgi:hypothetical protein
MTGVRTGGDLADLPHSFGVHCTANAKRRHKVCPGCDGDCSPVGLPRLAYTFELCDCGGTGPSGGPPFTHLVEQIWHRNCLTTENG